MRKNPSQVNPAEVAVQMKKAVTDADGKKLSLAQLCKRTARAVGLSVHISNPVQAPVLERALEMALSQGELKLIGQRGAGKRCFVALPEVVETVETGIPHVSAGDVDVKGRKMAKRSGVLRKQRKRGNRKRSRKRRMRQGLAGVCEVVVRLCSLIGNQHKRQLKVVQDTAGRLETIEKQLADLEKAVKTFRETNNDGDSVSFNKMREKVLAQIEQLEQESA